jgi:uncharacterized flavoprotein (TIGR03862 family)
MAAEAALAAGATVEIFDAMPSVGRKFLLAGKGGLNLTHAEAHDRFRARYDAAPVQHLIDEFPAEAIRAWAAGLGVATVVGSSNRVFPEGFKAAPLLRRWLARLRMGGVRVRTRHRFVGWEGGQTLLFDTPDGPVRVAAAATVLALGGASWPRLGSDGRWFQLLAAREIPPTPLAPANAGVECGWSTHFSSRHAGTPLKRVSLRTASGASALGECIVTSSGLEGGVIYALGRALRSDLLAHGKAAVTLDLLPGVSTAALSAALAIPRGQRTWSEHLRRKAHLCPARIGLLYECLGRSLPEAPDTLAAAIKALSVEVKGMRPLAEAISTAGGVAFAGLSPDLMALAHPGLFIAGEMLDWDAPTGGYLLSACLATGRHAGHAAANWVRAQGAGVGTP